MNLQKLIKIQDRLDQHIIKEKGLQGQDLLPKKILALQVELGELANEARFFKFWSEDQEPRTEHECSYCEGVGYFNILREPINEGEGERIIYIDCQYCNGEGYLDKNPLLEEYVDCLHFALSIGLELEMNNEESIKLMLQEADEGTNTPIIAFQQVLGNASNIYWGIHYNHYMNGDYVELVQALLKLGELLEFTEHQIEQAYLEKNQINHARQQNGY
jgi:dimeric dUTPase (all-alpha-NTP-PPase superfamily)